MEPSTPAEQERLSKSDQPIGETEQASENRKAYLDYQSAKIMVLEKRFPGVTDEEIALWIEDREIIPFDSPYESAGEADYWKLKGDTPREGEEALRLARLLNQFYFSEQQLRQANPQRWVSYPRLKALAEEKGIPESHLMAIIEKDIEVIDPGPRERYEPKGEYEELQARNLLSIEFDDPIPRSWDEAKARTTEAKIKGAMYRVEWIQDKLPLIDLADCWPLQTGNGGIMQKSSGQSSIIRNIGGREALPVWALPYVNLTGWRVLAGFEDMLHSLAHKGQGMSWMTSYTVNQQGEVLPVNPIQWEDCLDYSSSVVQELKEGAHIPQSKLPLWRESLVRYMPSSAFVFVEELTAWYYEAIEKNVDQETGKIHELKKFPDGTEEPFFVPYRRENYALVLDPIIPQAIYTQHKEWFEPKAQGQASSENNPAPALSIESPTFGDSPSSCDVNRFLLSPPLLELPLLDFIETLAQAQNESSTKPFYRLPPREALCLMMGQGTDEQKEELEGDFYALKLFEDGEERQINRADILGNSPILSRLTVKLEEIILVYESQSRRWCFPWQDKAGEYYLYPTGSWAKPFKKAVHIPFRKAKLIWKEKFPNLTNREIALQLMLGKITFKDSEFANAKSSNCLDEILNYAARVNNPNLDRFLTQWHFAKEDVEGFNLTDRYWEFAEVLELAPRYDLSEDEVKGNILALNREYDRERLNPEPWKENSFENLIYPKALLSEIFDGFSESKSGNRSCELLNERDVQKLPDTGAGMGCTLETTDLLEQEELTNNQKPAESLEAIEEVGKTRKKQSDEMAEEDSGRLVFSEPWDMARKVRELPNKRMEGLVGNQAKTMEASSMLFEGTLIDNQQRDFQIAENFANTLDGLSTLSAPVVSQQYKLPITTAEAVIEILSKAKELEFDLNKELQRGTREKIKGKCHAGDGAFTKGWNFIRDKFLKNKTIEN